MMSASPSQRIRPRSRKCRVSREQLLVARAVVVRCAARRSAIPAGHPGALSWELAPWSEDDAAWFVTAVHPGGMTQEQVATLMGISPVRVRQLEVEAMEKLRLGIESIMASFRPSLLELALGVEELEPEDLMLGMFDLLDRYRRAELARANETNAPLQSAL
jgi:Sigma-70, region 4